MMCGSFLFCKQESIKQEPFPIYGFVPTVVSVQGHECVCVWCVCVCVCVCVSVCLCVCVCRCVCVGGWVGVGVGVYAYIRACMA